MAKELIRPINGWTKAKIKKAILNGNNGTKSEDNGSCAYRGENGNRCAIGCFIPDDLYSSNMEGKCGSDVLANFGQLQEQLPFLGHELDRLQSVHDNYYGLEYSEGLTVRAKMLRWVDTNVWPRKRKAAAKK